MNYKRIFDNLKFFDLKKCISFCRYASLKFVFDEHKNIMKYQFLRNVTCNEANKFKRKFDLVILMGGIGKNNLPQNLTILDLNDFNNHESELQLFGEDACFALLSPRFTFFGLADGVGGYNKSGIDPSKFSYNLMKFCLNESRALIDSNTQPNSRDIVSLGYNKLIASKEPIYGGSTVLLTNFDHNTGKINISNLGDSKITIIDNNNGRVFSSVSQQHYFNCPFQLGHIPVNNSRRESDLPEMSDVIIHQLLHNDIIVLGTDGFFDNMFESDILSTLEDCKNNSVHINDCFLILLEKARKYSLDSKRQSPFAYEYSKNSNKHISGGKEDDITVVLAVVVENQDVE